MTTLIPTTLVGSLPKPGWLAEEENLIAIRPKVSRMSVAAATGSGLPLGPSGLT